MYATNWNRLVLSRTISHILMYYVAANLLAATPARGQNLFFGSIGFPQPKGYLFTSDLDGGGLTNILPPLPDPAGPVSIDIDPAIRTVFWTDILSAGSNTWQLRSANFDGSSPNVLATWTDTREPYGLAADTVNKRLYWAERSGGNSVIKRSDYSGSGVITVATTNQTSITAIEVDPIAGYIFWVDRGGVSPSGVYRANLDGTSPQSLVTMAVNTYPGGVTVDPVTQTVYWSEYSGGTINTVSYNGGTPLIFMSGLPGPAGLDLDLTINRLYVVDRNAATVSWTTPAGIGLTTVFSPPPVGEMWDVAVTVVPEPASVMLFAASVVALLGFRRSAKR